MKNDGNIVETKTKCELIKCWLNLLFETTNMTKAFPEEWQQLWTQVSGGSEPKQK